MKFKASIILGALLLVGTSAFAQDSPKVEASVNYSYANFTPSYSSDKVSFNGGGGSLSYFFTHDLGIKGEVEGYSTSTDKFLIAPGNPAVPSGGTFFANGNLVTYMAGPVIKMHGRIEPFGEFLLGGAHSSVLGNLYNQIGSGFTAPGSNAFAFTVGGGLDIHITHAIAVRPAEVDYLYTHFSQGVLSNSNSQNTFRYQAGLVLEF
jgi:opacity protein-like surface antigen